MFDSILYCPLCMTGHSKNFSFVSFVSVKKLNSLNDDIKKIIEEKNNELKEANEVIAGMTTLSKHQRRA